MIRGRTTSAESAPGSVAGTARARGELAALVDTEARLDRELAEARAAARRSIEAAHQRAREAAGELDRELDRERAQLARAHAEATAAQLREIADAARDAIARCDAVHGDALAALVRELAARLVAIACDEGMP